MGGLGRKNQIRHGTWTQLPADALDIVWCKSEFDEALVLILSLLCVYICPMGSIHVISPSPASLSFCLPNMLFGEEFFPSSFKCVFIKTLS